MLDKLLTMQISEWSYREEIEENVRHIGPMAQQFYTTFGYGYDERSITTLDADGVALASIQALAERNEVLELEVAMLRDEVSRLRALEARITALETAR